jgi:thiol peroxidase
MANINFKGNPIETKGSLPRKGDKAPSFKLTNTSLQEVSLEDYKGKRVVLNIFPSIDTGTCAASVRRFNQEASGLQNTVVLNISKDLPFAQKRFCAAEGLENVENLSQYKDHSFSDAYEVDMLSGPLNGLMSRAVVVADENGTVLHSEQVGEIIEEPNYEEALKALN